MKKQPLISIIIPIYNIMDCLEKCVDSCIHQTYQNIEIIMVDDGSTDGTGQLCDKLKEKDQRIRVFHKENGGSSSARNLGIEQAKGEYLGFVDSDDFISPTMYEELMEAILTHEVAIAQVSRDEIDDKGNKLPDVCTPPKEAFLCTSDEFMKELLLHRGDCSFCTKLIKKDLFEEKRFPVGKLNEDFYLLLQMLKEIKGIYILPGQHYHVFYRIGSNTRKKDKNEFSRVFMDIVENADVAQEIVEKHYPELKEVCIRFGLFQRLDYMLHIPVAQMTKDNVFYQNVKAYLRKHWVDTIKNSYLTKKNKIYLILLTMAPKMVRLGHQKMKGLS
ncbi:MAG: glycosyltransferase family 2 protein [Lachnospiraceae bacterium]|nr:glycosyltransferase family 2 protein [Lachnospiraceae bacterium]